MIEREENGKNRFGLIADDDLTMEFLEIYCILFVASQSI